MPIGFFFFFSIGRRNSNDPYTHLHMLCVVKYLFRFWFIEQWKNELVRLKVLSCCLLIPATFRWMINARTRYGLWAISSSKILFLKWFRIFFFKLQKKKKKIYRCTLFNNMSHSTTHTQKRKRFQAMLFYGAEKSPLSPIIAIKSLI